MANLTNNIADLLEFKKSKDAINIEEVEPLEEILRDLVVEACLRSSIS